MTGSRTIAVALAVTAACGPSTPHPPLTPQTTEDLVEVPFPPPPARVETVPKTPASDAVWVDGEWTWRGRRWAWKSGYWTRTVAGQTYSPWQITRDAAGTVFVAPGTWRDDRRAAISSPAPLATAQASTRVIVNAEGEQEITGRNRAPDGGAPRRDAGG